MSPSHFVAKLSGIDKMLAIVPGNDNSYELRDPQRGWSFNAQAQAPAQATREAGM